MTIPSYSTIPFKCPSSDPFYSETTETRCITGYVCNAWSFCEWVCNS